MSDETEHVVLFAAGDEIDPHGDDLATLRAERDATQAQVADMRWALRWFYDALGGDHPEFTGDWDDWERARDIALAEGDGGGDD